MPAQSRALLIEQLIIDRARKTAGPRVRELCLSSGPIDQSHGVADKVDVGAGLEKAQGGPANLNIEAGADRTHRGRHARLAKLLGEAKMRVDGLRRRWQRRQPPGQGKYEANELFHFSSYRLILRLSVVSYIAILPAPVAMSSPGAKHFSMTMRISNDGG